MEARFIFVQVKEPGFAYTTGPEVNIINGVTFGANNFSPRYTNGYAYQPVLNWTFVSGRHTIKTGFDFNFVTEDNYFPGFFAGGYTYNSYADFVNNNPASFRQAFPGTGTAFPISHPNVNEYALFLQDAWRVTDRLTLNYGVRYDKFDYAQPTYRIPNLQLQNLGLFTDVINTDDKDFGPRFGFAYRVTKNDAFVIRGGYGIYYSRTPGLLLSTAILNNGFASQTYLITSNIPTYPNVLKAAPGPGTPPDIYVTDPKFLTARTQQFNLQTEFAVGTHSSVTVGYLGVNGSHLTRTRDINLFPSVATAGFICPTSAACTSADGTPVTYYRHPTGRPNTAFGRISLFDSGGNSIYHGLFVRYQRRFANHFTAQASYTWSHVIDTTPDGTSVVPGNAGDDAKVAQDTLLPNLDRGAGNSDIRHRLVFSFVYDLGSLAGVSNPVARGIFSHWQLGVITQAQSGRAFNDIATGDPGNDTNTANDRSPAAGRNTIRGPEFITADARISKDIPLFGERVRLRLMGEFFNLTNRANINGVQTTRYTFGLTSGVGFFRPTTNFLTTQSVFDPRIIQLAAKIVF
jgi:outer membrane receptor protein involved in Fe transport